MALSEPPMTAGVADALSVHVTACPGRGQANPGCIREWGTSVQEAALTTYDFQRQLAVGAEGEAQLDALFTQWFEITPATMDEQKTGIDRWFVRRLASADGIAGERFPVEYKTDLRAAGTGNAFVEMFHVHDNGRHQPGWVYSSISRWLIYYVPQKHRALVLSFADIRDGLRKWKSACHMGHVRNVSWDTWGLLVPLTELEHIARKSIALTL